MPAQRLLFFFILCLWLSLIIFWEWLTMKSRLDVDERENTVFRQQKDYCDCVRYEDEPLNPFHKASLTLLTSLHFNFALHLPTPTLLHWTCLYGEYDITGWRGLSRFKDFCKCSSCFGKKASRTLSLKAKHIKRKNNGIFTWCFCSGVKSSPVNREARLLCLQGQTAFNPKGQQLNALNWM